MVPLDFFEKALGVPTHIDAAGGVILFERDDAVGRISFGKQAITSVVAHRAQPIHAPAHAGAWVSPGPWQLLPTPLCLPQ